MDFETASRPHQTNPDEYQLVADPSWAQGRTLFGGLIAANLANAMADQAGDGHLLRVISIAFQAPVPPTGAIIRTSLDRRGGSTSFVSATLEAEGHQCARATAVFAANRDSTLRVAATPARMPIPRDQSTELPYLPGIVPEFLQHLELWLAYGGIPFSGEGDGSLGGYCRHRTPAFGSGAILGQLDAWPPAILPMATDVVMSSTMLWTAHLIKPETVVGDDWFEFGYRTVSAADGYTISEGTLSRGSEVIAWTEQVGAVFG